MKTITKADCVMKSAETFAHCWKKGEAQFVINEIMEQSTQVASLIVCRMTTLLPKEEIFLLLGKLSEKVNTI